MKTKYKAAICFCLALLFVAFYLNWKYEVIAFHPFKRDGQHDLKVMTWNVHCATGADVERQKRIADLILREDADLVLLNEYDQDCCTVVDSLLSLRYPYTEECQSHQSCGNIFYSRLKLFNSGRVKKSKNVERIQTIKATISVVGDSIQIFGVHMASNRLSENSSEVEDDDTSYNRYKLAQEERCVQGHWIKKAIMETKHPIIVMGDMNDFNCSAPLDSLTSCDLRDAWWEGGNGYGCTFHSGWMRLRIDHILHSKELKLQSIKVIETDLSDHNPVVAGFSISK